MRLVGSSQGSRPVRRAFIALGAVVLVASSLLAFLAPARAEDPGMHLVGTMRPFGTAGYPTTGPFLAVDPVNGLGFSIDQADWKPLVYDLTRQKIELKAQEARGEIVEQGKKADGTPYRVGVIDLPSFYADQDENKSATADVRRLLKQFTAQRVDSVSRSAISSTVRSPSHCSKTL